MVPPAVEVRVPHRRLFVVVEQGTEAAPELGVDELAGVFPGEVAVVEAIVLVQLVKVLGQFEWRRVVFDVYVGVGRRFPRVVHLSTSHDDWNNVVPAKYTQQILISFKFNFQFILQQQQQASKTTTIMYNTNT